MLSMVLFRTRAKQLFREPKSCYILARWLVVGRPAFESMDPSIVPDPPDRL